MTLDNSLETQMLNALELFHYSYRFRYHLFILVLEQGVDLQEIMTDLRLLNTSHIRIGIISADNGKLAETLDTWSLRGCPFEYYPLNADNIDSFTSKTSIDFQKSIPVFGLSDKEKRDSLSLDQIAAKVAIIYQAQRIYFLSRTINYLEINGNFFSHISSREITDLIEATADFNVEKNRIEFFLKYNALYGLEFVLLRGETGTLFQEIFTHRGVGTLITDGYSNIIRQAIPSDTLDISLLVKHHMHTGAILPESEDDVAQEIDNYFVYTVDGSIVATAKLIDYGECAEMGKFATLPRYQGKGRAFQLAEKMISIAREEGKTYLFALSVDERMWSFFQKLGFYVVDRKSLPEDWQENYDFNRPSKAFRLDLKEVG